MTTKEIEKLSNIPDELKDNSLFCLWRKELDKDGRPTKRPYNPHDPTKRAEVNDPTTFDTFENTLEVLRSRLTDFDGLGRLVTGDYVGIDIDHVETDADGKLIGAAAEIVDLIDGYTEYSPSGNGLRIFCRADALKYDRTKYKIKNGNIEIYVPGQTNRYLTMTGNIIQDVWTIPDRSDELQSVLDKYMKRTKKTEDQTQRQTVSELPLSQYEIIEAASNARNGAKFIRLFNGQWEGEYKSQSEADQALCNILAFYCRKDSGLMDSIFRSSGLYRNKWDREDYREATLKNAISLTSETYSPSMKTATQSESVDNKSENTSKQDVSSKPEGVKQDPVSQDTQPSSQEVFDEFMKEIESERFRPISTGIEQLDKALSGGLERKTLVTLAAAPGAGKTAIAQYLLENMAEKGHNVVYVNLEMDRSQLLSRSIARLSHEESLRQLKATPNVKNHLPGSVYADVDALTVRRGYKWTEDEKSIVEKTAAYYREHIAPHFQYVTTNPENKGSIDNTLSSILKKLETITADLIRQGQDAPLVCIDYLQFVEYDLMGENERKPDNAESIKQTLKAFKQYAMKHNTVVILITANNRASNSEGRASMDSARDTSNIEYSGDVMLSLVYTAVEERWLHVTGQDKSGNDKYAAIDNDFVLSVVDWTLRETDGKDVPLIAKLLSLKVVKGRGIRSRGAAKFVYDGRYFYFEPDTGHENPYCRINQEEPQ